MVKDLTRVVDLRNICHQHGYNSDCHNDSVIGRRVMLLGLISRLTGGWGPGASVCWHPGQMAAVHVISMQQNVKQTVISSCETIDMFRFLPTLVPR